MAVKQNNLYKDRTGKVTGMTVFYWGEQSPSILSYDPPMELRLSLKKMKRKRKSRASDRD